MSRLLQRCGGVLYALIGSAIMLITCSIITLRLPVTHPKNDYPMTEQEVVRALAALAQQSRLQIFRQLVVAGAAGMTPSRLSEVLDCLPTAL